MGLGRTRLNLLSDSTQERDDASTTRILPSSRRIDTDDDAPDVSTDQTIERDLRP